jgi:hypothetical protein
MTRSARPRLHVLVLLVALTYLQVNAQKVALASPLSNRVAIVAAKSYAWLMQNQNERQYKADVVWIFDILMRKFALAEPRAVNLFKRDVRDGRFWRSGFAPILHILVPEVQYRPDNATASQSPIDRIVNRAIWCDVMEPDPDLHMQMFNLAGTGGYELTHMYLAALILREKKCGYFNRHEKSLAELEERLAGKLELLCRRSRDISDLEIEAAAFLAYSHRLKPLSTPFLVRLLDAAENHLDNPFVSKMTGHTAVLILWYTLEVANPEAKQVPLAPRL